MTIHKNDQASVRIWAHNPDHHLYNNNGTWWLHYTAYPTPLTTQRLRRSPARGAMPASASSLPTERPQHECS